MFSINLLISKGMNMKIAIVTLLSLIYLTGCKPTEKDYINLGEGLVKSTLKDPDSAKFESLFKQSGESDGYVCGYVNAKNSYGGYTGKKQFYVYVDVLDGKINSNGPVKIINEQDYREKENYKLFCQ